MKKTRIKDSIDISLLGIGGIGLMKQPQSEVNLIIQTAYENGVNFIDSGRSYNESEKKIGNALQELKLREHFFLATKSLERNYDSLISEIDKSLQELNTDYVDLYQMHDVRFEEDYQQLMDGGYNALMKSKAEGKIRHIGVSAHLQDYIEKLLNDNMVDFIQIPLNVIDYLFFKNVIPLAIEKKCPIIAMKPLAGGLITDIEKSLRFLLNKGVTTIIPGVKTHTELIHNINIINQYSELTETESAELAHDFGFIDNRFCRGCGYCLPCPAGIDIPQMFLYERYCKTYFLREWALEQYEKKKNKISDCLKCASCIPKCPYNVNIIDRLQEIENTLYNLD